MKFNHVIFLLSLAVFALLSSACGGSAADSTEAVDLAVINGCHSNAPLPAIQSTTVSDTICSSTASYGSVCVIVDDGAPFVAADYDISVPEKDLSASKRAEIAQAQAAQILSVLSGSSAVTPEVDTLAALSLAARSLNDAQGTRCILVLDSGLSTCGYVDFTQNLLRADSEAGVSYLRETNALPELTGVNVVWVGLGDVSGEQPPLTPANLETLRDIWEKVLLASGAASVEFAADLPGSVHGSSQQLPYVTPVDIIRDAPITIDETLLDFDEPLILDETKVLFLPDTATFADHDAVAATISPIAEYMVCHSDFRLLLAGTTATSGTNESCKPLSLARAAAVRDLLFELGVPQEQVAGILGLGFEHKYHIADLDASGNLNANAPANRSVILLDASSHDAMELEGLG